MKLLSPVVEVTTSLSKDSSPTKVIQIRPLNVIRRDSENAEEQKSLEQEYENIQTQIKQAREKLQKLKRKQNELIEETETTIQKKKEAWKEEKKTYINEAHDEGYKDGFDRGKEEGLQIYKERIEQVNQIIEAATTDYEQTLKQSEGMIIDLAMKTAEKILTIELNEDPKAFIHIVEKALQELTEQPHIDIYVHASQYEYVLQQKHTLKQHVNEQTKLSIYIDPEIEKYSCYIDYPAGKIDVSIDTQLKELYKALQNISAET